MIRLAIPALLFLMLSVPCISSADETIPSQQSDNRQEQQTTEQAEMPKNETTWPHPFVPSEEVGADSQVAFPTDI